MATPMKVIAINGSPHTAVGNTSLMLQMMRPALAAEGIALEEVFLAEKRIEYCVGCALCLEKGKCWRRDDHAEIVRNLLDADGVILASPVFFMQVTAQLKTFLDRSLAFGHKPRTAWKPGLAISVSAGMGETATAEYLAGMLRVYGAFPIGTLTALAVSPGGILGVNAVEARARALALDLARAIQEKRRYPATDRDLSFYLFMRHLVQQERDFMRDDYAHWEKSGFLAGFEAYVGERFAAPQRHPDLRREWLRHLISQEASRTKGMARPRGQRPSAPPAAGTCTELLASMPLGFDRDAAGDLRAVYQFELTGAENLTAQLRIADGRCTYAVGGPDTPDVIIKSPADIWLAISRGDLDGQAAFMTGKYRVEGNLSLLLKLRTLFSS